MINKTTNYTLDLTRFIDAQNETYTSAMEELTLGKKKTHWMWFVFPQLDGLGSSAKAIFYAIKNEEEAKAYLKHPLLGKRLRECTEAILEIKQGSALEVFGFPDNLKLQSSMTLFNSVSKETIYSSVLEKFYDGKPDINTMNLLKS